MMMDVTAATSVEEEKRKVKRKFKSLPKFPPGFKFTPKDGELVNFYLIQKLKNIPLPLNIINDVNLYDESPDHLVDVFGIYEELGKGKLYFFTPRERKYPNGGRPKRGAKHGFWKATGSDKKVQFDGKTIGLKKTLVFSIGKPPEGERTEWIMHEYTIIHKDNRLRRPDGPMRLDDWVLCTIHKRRGAASKSDGPTTNNSTVLQCEIGQEEDQTLSSSTQEAAHQDGEAATGLNPFHPRAAYLDNNQCYQLHVDNNEYAFNNGNMAPQSLMSNTGMMMHTPWSYPVDQGVPNNSYNQFLHSDSQMTEQYPELNHCMNFMGGNGPDCQYQDLSYKLQNNLIIGDNLTFPERMYMTETKK